MALIAVAADKGSPGVTTAALSLAAVWPRRALLAELDPSGGDVALRLRGPRRVPLSPETGLLSLAVGVRRGATPQQVFEHVQRLDGGLEVVLGLSSGEQATGLTGLWSPVAVLLETVSGADVIADCGRLYTGSPAADVVVHASAVVLVTRSTIDAVAHLRTRAAAVVSDINARSTIVPPVFVVVITSPRDTKSAQEIQLVLRQAQIQATVIGRIALDPRGAGLLAGDWAGRLDRSLLIRSAREVAAKLAQATTARAQAV
jgi:MinD-like ATPase involved in chromosome partitioning or flagellar assembly